MGGRLQTGTGGAGRRWRLLSRATVNEPDSVTPPMAAKMTTASTEKAITQTIGARENGSVPVTSSSPAPA